LFAKLFHKLPGAKWLELLVLLYDFLFLPTTTATLKFFIFHQVQGPEKGRWSNGALAMAFGCNWGFGRWPVVRCD